jgi:hypothetical protein
MMSAVCAAWAALRLVHLGKLAGKVVLALCGGVLRGPGVIPGLHLGRNRFLGLEGALGRGVLHQGIGALELTVLRQGRSSARGVGRSHAEGVLHALLTLLFTPGLEGLREHVGVVGGVVEFGHV